MLIVCLIKEKALIFRKTQFKILKQGMLDLILKKKEGIYVHNQWEKKKNNVIGPKKDKIGEKNRFCSS